MRRLRRRSRDAAGADASQDSSAGYPAEGGSPVEGGAGDVGTTMPAIDSGFSTEDSSTPPPPDAGAPLYAALVTGAGNGGALQVVGIRSSSAQAYLADYQTTSGAWTAGGPLPGQTATFSTIATAAGMSGGSQALQVLGLGVDDGQAYVAAWQDGGGVWHAGAALPATSTRLTALAPGVGISGGSASLQIVGLGASDRLAYLVAWQDSSGNWSAGGMLPSQTEPLAAIATGIGTTGSAAALQVLGLGASDGFVYVVGWQDSTGNWHGAGPVPNQTVKMSAIATAVGSSGGASSLQVIGLGAADGLPYVAAWQDSSGNWHAGSMLPAPSVELTAITTGTGTSGGEPSLQVLGLGVDGHAYVTAWQDASGNWHPGQELPGQSSTMSAVVAGPGWSGGAASLQVIGLSSTGQPWALAWQDSSGNWLAGGALP